MVIFCFFASTPFDWKCSAINYKYDINMGVTAKKILVAKEFNQNEL